MNIKELQKPMSAAEFNRIGIELFGCKWEKRMQEFLRMTSVTVSEYKSGKRKVNVRVGMVLRLFKAMRVVA